MLKRVICLPFLIGMAQLPVISKAQLTKEKSEKRIVINSNTIRVADLLGLFARETDLEFSFNSKKLSPSKMITVAHHEQTLSAWLKELEKSTGIHVRVKGDHIILQDMPPVVNASESDNALLAANKSNAFKEADSKKAGSNTIAGNAAANKIILSKGIVAGDATKATDERNLGNNAIATNTPAAKGIKDNGRNTGGAGTGDLPADGLSTEKETTKHDQIITGNKSDQQAGDRENEAVNGKGDREQAIASIDRDRTTVNKNNTASKDKGNAKSETSLSTVLSEVLGKGELLKMPAHEMPAPDKHISLAAHKTVVYPKDTTVAATATIADSTRKEAPPLRTVTRIDLGLQGLGISLEVPVGRKYTIEFSGGLGGGYEVSDSSFSYDWGLLNPCAYFSVNGRYYYNRDRRAAKRKSLLLNAGDYFGVRLKYTSPEVTGDGSMSDAVLVNVHWGMQRPIGRKWTINGHAGIGWGYNAINSIAPGGGRVYPAAEFKISYALNRKRHL